jgi:hypothetical protein
VTFLIFVALMNGNPSRTIAMLNFSAIRTGLGGHDGAMLGTATVVGAGLSAAMLKVSKGGTLGEGLVEDVVL